MKVMKKVISDLPKNYALCPLHYKGKEHFLVASELDERCLLFDLDGNLVDTVWEHPGGVMSMVQIPGTDGQFLATHRFWGFNNASSACISVVTPDGNGHWNMRTLVDLPFIHRIDIVERNGVRWLVACVLKSGHEYDDDWRFPGKVLAAILPENIDAVSDGRELELRVIADGLFRNHGYYRIERDDGVHCMIAAESGAFLLTPPAAADGQWNVETLITDPTSDAALLDFDGDGEDELGTIAPFHGDTVRIYKRINTEFKKVYETERALPFAHAFFAGMLCGRPSLVIGNRAGERELTIFQYDPGRFEYFARTIDRGHGPANVLHYIHNGKDVLAVTNRETDEVALYILEGELC